MIGNITKDLELKYTASNIPVTRFSIAINQGYGDKQQTDYINCIVWRKQAENLCKYCGRGSKVAIEGRLQNYSYEDSNREKKYGMQVVADNITFLDSKKKDTADSTQSSAEISVEEKEDPFADFGEEVVLNDEDLPF